MCRSPQSSTSDEQLDSYVARLDELPYQRMFFVYHTGRLSKPESDRVVVIGPDRLATLVLDAGLVGWLIDRVS